MNWNVLVGYVVVIADRVVTGKFVMARVGCALVGYANVTVNVAVALATILQHGYCPFV